MDTDQAVQDTNSEAVISKFSCVLAGYYEDEFLKYFVPNPVKRNPIINKGYYVRVSLFNRLYSEFMEAHQTGCQLVVLGAGTDTSGLHAIKNYIDHDIRVFEIDFAEMIHKKLRIIRKHPREFSFIDSEPSTYDSVNDSVSKLGKKLSLIMHDLRDPIEALDWKLASAGFDRAKPTLFVSECVLIYLDMGDSNRVIEWVAKKALSAGTPRIMAIYEQINPTDAFGRMMMENLTNRGCALRSVMGSPSAMQKRLLNLGFENAITELMSYFDPLIKNKRPEIIDELEEYNLLQNHYAFSVAWSTDDKLSAVTNDVMKRNDNQQQG